MKQLKFLGETYEAEKIVKSSNNIIGYNNEDTEVFSMCGISEFKDYKLLDNAEWDLPTESPNMTELKAENMALKVALAELAETQQSDKQQMQLAIAEIAELIVGGEANR